MVEIRGGIGPTKVMVTGGAGFIGSRLVEELLKGGFRVALILIEDENTTRIDNLLDHLEIFRADLRDTEAVEKAVYRFQPEIVYHLATYYSVKHSRNEIAPMISTNVLGTVNILESSASNNTRLFINASSCFVYKASHNPLSETDPIDPWNLYALTKLQAEEACSYYSQQYDISAISLRLFPPYGPGDHERRLIPTVIRSALKGDELRMTSGEQSWDFIYIDDVVEAMIKAMQVIPKDERHDVINIGTGRAVSIRAVVEKILELLGSDQEPQWGALPQRDNERLFLTANIDKAISRMSWKPVTDIMVEGLERTIEKYRYSI
jgi:nucleoside-diphosphate-sugar epimerase